jgi:hypothetical protein
MLSPETQSQRLQMFDKYNLPYQATEFEIRDHIGDANHTYVYTDDEIKQLTEETMTIYLSHPKVEGFWHWTFVDDKNGTLPWALFNYDGTPKPTGEKWIELMEGKFDTDTTLTSDVSGKCISRGFKGEYDIEITYENSTINRTLYLENDTLASINTPFHAQVTSVKNIDDKSPFISMNNMQKSFSIHGVFGIQKITLFDLYGRTIHTYQADHTYSLEGIPNGLYIVLIKSNKKAVTMKIIVQ